MPLLEDNNLNNWKVYLHTIPKEITGTNNKYYVGITSKTLTTRFGKTGNNYKTQYFYEGIQQYGWDNIKHEILIDNLSLHEALQKEAEYISFYHSDNNQFGYNKDSSSENTMFHFYCVQYDEQGNYIQTFDNRFDAQDYIGHCIIYGDGHLSNGFQWRLIKYGEEIPRKISEFSYTGYKIGQYDFDGNFIDLFKNKKQIFDKLGFKLWSIDNAEFGYQWIKIFNDEIPIKIPSFIPYTGRKVVEKYDIYGNFIRDYESVKMAEMEYPSTNITKACQVQKTLYVGFQWKFKDDSKEIVDLSKDKRYWKIYLYTLDGDLIKSFDTKRQAELYIGNNNGAMKIDDYVFENLYINNAFGYRWTNTYYEQLPPLLNFDKRFIPVVQINLNGELINIYGNGIEAFNNLKTESTSPYDGRKIVKCCKDYNKTVLGYKWKYIFDVNESDFKDSFLLQKYQIYMSVLKSLGKGGK